MRRDDGINSMAHQAYLETVPICIVFASAFAQPCATRWAAGNSQLQYRVPHGARQSMAGSLYDWRFHVSTWASISSGQPPLMERIPFGVDNDIN
jgi:hypothetical protein